MRNIEETGCEIICGAPTTLMVKGLMMMMNFAWGLPSCTRFDTLTFFEDHRCVRIINCKLFFEILVYHSLNFVWFLHALKSAGTACFVRLLCI